MNPQALAQQAFDNRQPPPVSESPREDARAEWLYNAAEDLIRGADVKFQRRMSSPQCVTAKQFVLAVDEHVNNRLADGDIGTPSLGWLMIENMRGRADKVSAAELLGHSDRALGMLGEIAESLLEPLADDALIAQAEDDEL